MMSPADICLVSARTDWTNQPVLSGEEMATITLQHIHNRIIDHKFAVLASFDGQYPYCSLMSFYLEPKHNALYLVTSRKTYKYKNITAHPRVSLLIDNRSNDPRDVENAYAITIIGDVEELTPVEEAAIRPRYQEKHPLLTDFVSDETSAILKIKIRRYIMVDHFQQVTQIVI